MQAMASASGNIILGTIAGATIFLGLPIARWKGASEQLRGALALISAGILLFLIIEVGHNAIEIVESTAKGGQFLATLWQANLLIAGLIAGLVGLGWWEEERSKMRSQGATPLEVANMIAIGIGLHNFAEGLAIGQSFSGGQISLGLTLVIGFALHNATEGFGIAAPLVGQDIAWTNLLVLGLIGGGPTAIGAFVGGSFVSENIQLLFLSLAAGSLIYVTRELFRLRFAALTSAKATAAIALGLILGIATEIFVEVASVRSAQSSRSEVATQPVTKTPIVTFETNKVEPSAIKISQGQRLLLINKTNKSMEFEGHGLIPGEAFLEAKGKLAVKIIGPAGQYHFSPEGDDNRSVIVDVIADSTDSDRSAVLNDPIQAVAAIVTLEGHVRAAHDLHEGALNGTSQNPVLDLKRAGKHAHHPMHELLEDKGPRALMVQKYLENGGFLVPLKEKLEEYSKLAGSKDTPDAEFRKKYDQLLGSAESARSFIGGASYKTPSFTQAVVHSVLESTEAEYKEAVENGAIEVIEPAVPGKDGYLEYQDVRGFLKACRSLLDKQYDQILTPDAQQAFSSLLDKEFKTVDPLDPKDPTPFETVEKQLDRISDGFR